MTLGLSGLDALAMCSLLQRREITIRQCFGDYFVNLIGIERIYNRMLLVRPEDVNWSYEKENQDVTIDPRRVSFPVYWGVDRKDRPFIIVKTDYFIEGKIVQLALVIFKKYIEADGLKKTGLSLKCPETQQTVYVPSENLYATSLRNIGTDGNVYLTPNRLRAKQGMTPRQMQLIIDLIDGQKIELADGDYIRKSV